MISDTDLVTRCIKGEQSAWSLFFNRYNRHIDRQIIRIFCLYSYPFTEEDFNKVKNDVIDLIQLREKLERITNKEDIKAWLSTVSRNKAIDYIRKKKSVRSSFEQEVERNMVSLQDSLSPGSDHTLEDVTSQGEETEDSPAREMAKRVIKMIEGMDEKYRIPMKLYLTVHYNSLSSDEIIKIAKKRGINPEEVKQQIDQLTDNLLKKHEKTIRQEGEIVFLAAYVNRLKSRIHYLRQYPEDHHQKILEVEKELEKKETRLEKLRNKKPNPVVPSNKDIGTVLSLRSNTVAIRIFRAKRAIEKGMIT